MTFLGLNCFGAGTCCTWDILKGSGGGRRVQGTSPWCAKTPLPCPWEVKAQLKRGGFLGNGRTHFISLPVSQLWQTLLICANSFCSLVKINVQCRKEIQLRLPGRKGYSLEGGNILSAEGEQGWIWDFSLALPPQTAHSTYLCLVLPGWKAENSAFSLPATMNPGETSQVPVWGAHGSRLQTPVFPLFWKAAGGRTLQFNF